MLSCLFAQLWRVTFVVSKTTVDTSICRVERKRTPPPNKHFPANIVYLITIKRSGYKPMSWSGKIKSCLKSLKIENYMTNTIFLWNPPNTLNYFK